ncbi:hypothetical protein M3202_07925 [Alkalihalobacillus oceani]|uniref:DUF4352 domain-containing protein n=1 Tax=Halalkalibacter oceani TaxID=1653776 RepID=A0A9X2DRC5_9BACI|nr:hypothetical protein [Halalkalibacter oceani]MCM3714012.1 hypothetical protein [Halalkalibacter oceani]
MKKSLFVSLSLIFIATSSNVVADNVIVKEVRNQVEHVLFESAEEITNHSDLVIEAVATDKSENIIMNEYGFRDGRTNTEVLITNIIKDDHAVLKENQTLKVTEPYYRIDNGIQPGETIYFYDDYTPLQAGAEYILFLKYREGSKSYWINSLNQGKFNIDEKDEMEEELNINNEQYSELKVDVLETYDDN